MTAINTGDVASADDPTKSRQRMQLRPDNLIRLTVILVLEMITDSNSLLGIHPAAGEPCQRSSFEELRGDL